MRCRSENAAALEQLDRTVRELERGEASALEVIGRYPPCGGIHPAKEPARKDAAPNGQSTTLAGF